MIGAGVSALARLHVRRWCPTFPRSTAEVPGPYAVQGKAQKVAKPALQLQLPWLDSTQAASGELSATAHWASLVQVMHIPEPWLQKLAPPVVGKQKQEPPPQVAFPVRQKSLAAVQRPTLCARHRWRLQRPEQHWLWSLQCSPTSRQPKWVAPAFAPPSAVATAPRALPAKPLSSRRRGKLPQAFVIASKCWTSMA